MRMRFILSTSPNGMSNRIETNLELCEIIGEEAFPFSHSCDLEWWSGSQRLISNVRFNSLYHHAKYEAGWPKNVRFHANSFFVCLLVCLGVLGFVVVVVVVVVFVVFLFVCLFVCLFLGGLRRGGGGGGGVGGGGWEVDILNEPAVISLLW